MKKIICLCAVLLCLLTTASCHHPGEASTSGPALESSSLPPSSEAPSTTLAAPSTRARIETTTSKPLILSGRKNRPYFKAYAEFLLHSDTNMEEDPGFPIFGYYLIDLNFDRIPELGVYRDSGGSLGGYLNFYSFDGKKVAPVLEDGGEQARSSTHTKILADKKNQKVYLFKEMYLLQGNSNGLNGYVKEIKSRNGVPHVCNIITLDVDHDHLQREDLEKSHDGEDLYLLDTELDHCLLTKRYSNGKSKEISSAHYLKKKRQIIPEKNSFVDLLDTKARVVCDSIMELLDEDSRSHDKKLTSEEIDLLFTKWLDQTK